MSFEKDQVCIRDNVVNTVNIPKWSMIIIVDEMFLRDQVLMASREEIKKRNIVNFI